jgi:hypothetical protein
MYHKDDPITPVLDSHGDNKRMTAADPPPPPPPANPWDRPWSPTVTTPSPAWSRLNWLPQPRTYHASCCSLSIRVTVGYVYGNLMLCHGIE